VPASLTEPAHAKVNLFLHLLGRRPDGYHLLDSLVVFPAIADRLTATDGDDLSLTLEGPFAPALAAEPDNLVLRAARALAAEAGVAPRAHIVLRKNLPVASGIGGGSADAAAALRLLCRLWCIAPDLAPLAATLGADVPVCLAGNASRMAGIGERLTQAPTLPDCGVVLVNPGIAVPTAEVFRARQGPWSAPAILPSAWPDAAAMAADLAGHRNDLQPPAVALYPSIGAVLDALAVTPGCLLARMSGSGATCFGLFATAAVATHAADTLRRPAWWIWGGRLQPSTPRPRSGRGRGPRP
jgi:4-diphosphocytidyl-2-C-methyl-D-erythritol kinase